MEPLPAPCIRDGGGQAHRASLARASMEAGGQDVTFTWSKHEGTKMRRKHLCPLAGPQHLCSSDSQGLPKTHNHHSPRQARTFPAPTLGALSPPPARLQPAELGSFSSSPSCCQILPLASLGRSGTVSSWTCSPSRHTQPGLPSSCVPARLLLTLHAAGTRGAGHC